MKQSGNINTKIILLLLALSLGIVGCKTTNTNVSESDNSIQQELDALDTVEETADDAVAEEYEFALPPLENRVFKLEDHFEVMPKLSPEEERYINVQSKCKDQKNFYEIAYTYDYKEVGEDLDYKVYVKHDEKEVILLYEETDSEQDWHNNYLIFPWPLKLDNHVIWTTYGYAKIYKSANSIPLDEFCALIEQYPDYKVVFRGWSLGSAMAKITARHYLYRMPKGTKIDELTTYGDVKCWFNPFYSLKKHCVRIREYTNRNDLITWCMPFYRRDVTCKVGQRFSLKTARNSEYYHMHYDECDLSKWDSD